MTSGNQIESPTAELRHVGLAEMLDLRGEIISNMGEGVCLVTTGNERIVFANPSLERMLGYEPGELIGRRAVEVMLPEDLTPASGWRSPARSSRRTTARSKPAPTLSAAAPPSS
jgi:PAS domain S-box-containing protein